MRIRIRTPSCISVVISVVTVRSLQGFSLSEAANVIIGILKFQESKSFIYISVAASTGHGFVGRQGCFKIAVVVFITAFALLFSKENYLR